MNQVTWSELSSMGAANVEKQIPLEILVDSEAKFIISGIDDVIVVSDLHIRVRNTLKAQEKRARSGMPKPIRVDRTTKDEE